MKRSTSEEMQMKNEELTSKKMIEVKSNTPINSSKKADNRASDTIKNERKKAYQRADSTQSHSSVERMKITRHTTSDIEG